MDLITIISSLAGLLLVGLVLKPVADRMRFPFEALLLLLGFTFGSLVAHADHVGLHSGVLRDLVFYVFLPVLIFSAAYRMDVPGFGRNLFGILLLALPLSLICVVLTSVLIYYGIGSPSGFPLDGGPADRHHADRHQQPDPAAGLQTPAPGPGPAHADRRRGPSEQRPGHRAVLPAAGLRLGARPDPGRPGNRLIHRLGSARRRLRRLHHRLRRPDLPEGAQPLPARSGPVHPGDRLPGLPGRGRRAQCLRGPVRTGDGADHGPHHAPGPGPRRRITSWTSSGASWPPSPNPRCT